MDWNLITAIATVIGVVGGIVSVGFLVFEVRHNTHAIEGATVQSLMSLERDVFALLADNAELFLRGCETIEALTREERFRFDRVVGAQMSLIYSAFVQHGEGLMDDEIWDAYLNAVGRYMVFPGFAESWGALKPAYPRSFRAAIGRRFPEAG